MRGKTAHNQGNTLLVYHYVLRSNTLARKGAVMALGDTFKALSEALRRRILVMLREGRMTAGDIAKRLGITPAALSYHLSMLKKCDLVTEYKVKNYVYYELNTSVLDEVALWFGQLGGKKNENENKDPLADNAASDDNSGGSGSVYAGQNAGSL